MGNKELDSLIESYFKSADVLSQKNDLLSFDVLVEMRRDAGGSFFLVWSSRRTWHADRVVLINFHRARAL